MPSWSCRPIQPACVNSGIAGDVSISASPWRREIGLQICSRMVTVNACAYRALFSVTAPTEHGLVVVNVWESPEGAAAFRQLPPIQEAQRASVLPSPRFFERFTDAQLKEYPRGTSPTN